MAHAPRDRFKGLSATTRQSRSERRGCLTVGVTCCVLSLGGAVGVPNASNGAIKRLMGQKPSASIASRGVGGGRVSSRETVTDNASIVWHNQTMAADCWMTVSCTFSALSNAPQRVSCSSLLALADLSRLVQRICMITSRLCFNALILWRKLE